MTPPTLKITGIKGDKGDTGEQGIQGLQGIQGIQGIQGEKGDKGEQGPIGPQGIDGKDGKDGLDGIDGVSPVLDYEKIAKKLPKEDITPKIISEIKKLNKDRESKISLEIKDLKGGKEIIKEVKGFYASSGQEYRIDGVKKAGNASVLNLKAGTGITLSGSPTSDGAEIIINATGGDTPTLQEVTDEGATTTHDIEANSFITTGGTSSDFVKGDGSLDSSTYVTGATNSTLTLTGTTLGLNLGNANTWTATQTNSQTTTATPVDGWVLSTSSTATSGNQKSSTAATWRGSGWKTYSTASARSVDFRAFVLPEQGSSNPTGLWKLQTQVNNGGWSDVISVDNKVGGVGFKINTSGSNGNPGTTRAITIDNAGTYTWADYRFSSTLRVATGANSSGGYDVYTSGGNGLAVYSGNSGLTSNSLVSYNYSGGFVHTGFGLFGGKVNAGSASTPATTLYSSGSFGTYARRVTSNYTITSTDSVIYADASSAACAGTPTYACSHWGNQSDCEKWDAHGGCTWFAGSSCSVFDNESGMSACSGQAGCTVVTASCAGPTDQSSCEAQDDNYGGACSWNTSNDCSVLNESACGFTSGCTQNFSDCSGFNGNESGCAGQSGCSVSSSNTCPSQMDEGSCTGAGCSWDGMTCSGDNSTCSGTYYSSCSGNYNTCDGTYNTGSCSGTYGAQCQGTSSCSGIDDSTNCGNETGCTWSTSITLNFPSVVTVPNMHVWVYNASSSSADVICQPYSGDTFDQTTSYTLSNYKDAIHAQAFSELTSCASFNEGACTPSGCTKTYTACSWNPGDNTCSGNVVCTGIGDQSTCEATTYFSSCNGNYYSVKNWYLLSRS